WTGISMKVSANLATMKCRRQWLPRCVESLYHQFDVVNIWCNDYKPSKDERNRFDNVEYYWGNDYTDNAKFMWVDDDCWYFSHDDDICAPGTYRQDMMKYLKANPETIYTHHGRILDADPSDYYRSGEMFYYSQPVRKARHVDVCGTGVTAFNSKIWKPDVFQYGKNK